MASSLVTAFKPPFVSDANADGTAEFALSTRLVDTLTRWPPSPPVSIADTAARGKFKEATEIHSGDRVIVSSVYSVNGLAMKMPALLTTM